jgi:hypothetical protein
MTNRKLVVAYLREDGGYLGSLAIPKNDRESDVPLEPQGKKRYDDE